MAEAVFLNKIDYACQKKEDLFDKSKARYAIRSMYAGAFLTLSTAAGVIGADLLNTMVPGAGRFLFPFVFSWGLVYILFLNAELTTSNMMYLTAGVFLGKIKWQKALIILLYCTFFNLLGALLTAFLFNQTSAFKEISPHGFLAGIAEHKLARPSSLVLFEGIIANVFVNIAIISYLIMKDSTAKILMTVSAISMFVFLTNEHIAANFASFSLVFFNEIASKVEYFDLLNIFRHFSVTFLANWIGGGLLMGLAYAWLNKNQEKYLD